MCPLFYKKSVLVLKESIIMLKTVTPRFKGSIIPKIKVALFLLQLPSNSNYVFDSPSKIHNVVFARNLSSDGSPPLKTSHFSHLWMSQGFRANIFSGSGWPGPGWFQVVLQITHEILLLTPTCLGNFLHLPGKVKKAIIPTKCLISVFNV